MSESAFQNMINDKFPFCPICGSGHYCDQPDTFGKRFRIRKFYCGTQIIEFTGNWAMMRNPAGIEESSECRALYLRKKTKEAFAKVDEGAKSLVLAWAELRQEFDRVDKIEANQ